jgi:hypothetical protein
LYTGILLYNELLLRFTFEVVAFLWKTDWHDVVLKAYAFVEFQQRNVEAFRYVGVDEGRMNDDPSDFSSDDGLLIQVGDAKAKFVAL